MDLGTQVGAVIASRPPATRLAVSRVDAHAAAAARRAQRLLRARRPVEQPVAGDARALEESAAEVVRSVINSSGS